MNFVRSRQSAATLRSVLLFLILVAFSLPATELKAQTPGALDLSFDAEAGFVNNVVSAVVPHADGKVLIGGGFTTVRGAMRSRVARLSADGTVDESFNPGSGANNTVNSVVLQSDGKVLIAGNFTTFNGMALNRIARLNGDGSLDTSFNLGSGADNSVYSLALQSDGKVLVGGNFTTFNGTARNRIARLNGDGSLDTSFNPGSGASSEVRSVAVQSDGKVLIGGWFTSLNGTARKGLARLNADGSLDASFNPNTGAYAQIYSISVQSGGKALIGGAFNTINGTARNYIARLNEDGSLDTNFNPGSGANNLINTLAVQSDGKVLITGPFTSFNGTERNRIARLNGDGSLDTSFNPGSGVDSSLNPLAVQSDGKVLIGGLFTRINGMARNCLARLNTDGSLDTHFNPGAGANGQVYSLTVQGDGKVLIGGYFTSISDTDRNGIARLNANGTLDTGFNPGSGADNLVNSLAVQSDGKVLLGGLFTSIDGMARNGLARLNADGSLDASFNPILDNSVRCLAVQSDGKVLIGGLFTSIDGIARIGLARLNTDGSLDSSFNPVLGTANSINSLAVQSDGRVLIGGYFTSIGGTARNRIARLNADGGLDTSFNPGSGADNSVFSVAVQGDGKVLIGGSFTRINGTGRSCIARLNANGTLDTGFTPSPSLGSSALSVAVQGDGKVLMGGSFINLSGPARNRIARLNANGTLDTAFNPGSGAEHTVNALAVQSDGKVLIGGSFTSFNGTERSYLARLENDPATQRLTALSASHVEWLRGGASPEAQEVSFELSTTGGSTWTALGKGTRISAGWELTGLSLPASGEIRARARTTGGSYNSSSGLMEAVHTYSFVSAPSAITGTAANITRTSADLSGMVNANGADASASFQYGPTTAYDSSVTVAPSPVTGTSATAVSATLTGLLPHTTYHFRAVAQNSEGTSYGDDVSFTTSNSQPVAQGDSSSVIAGRSVSIAVLGNDSDMDGDTLAVTGANGATLGNISVVNGTILYQAGSTPGTDSFTYTISDGFEGSASATVTVNVAPNTPTSILLAIKGATVPGAGIEDSGIPAGSVWSSFGVPSINDSAAVAFLGNVKSGSTSFSGIFAGEQSAPVLVARKGDAAPGTNGALFASFRDPLLSNAGEVVIIANLSGSGVQAKNRQGIWKATPAESGGYTLDLLARTGDEPSGVAGARWKSFASVLLHGEAADPSTRSVVALASMVVGPGKVTSANDVGLWCFDAEGARLLLREGQSLEVRGVTSKVKTLTALSSVPGSPGHGRVSATQGSLVRVKLSDGRYALLQADGESSLAVLAATGDELEAGVLVASLGIPGGNLAGFSGVTVTLKGPGVTSASKTAIALFSAEESAELLHRTGVDPLPAGFPQIKTIGDPVANSGGDAFLATLTGAGVKNGTNTALVWREAESGDLTMVAREGAEPTGVPGAQWASFTSVALPEERGPLFTAKLRTGSGGVKSISNVGLWGTDSTGTLHLIAREGDQIEGKSLRSFTILSSVLGSPAQRRSYNGQGALIYRAYFTDGSQALIQVQLP